MMSEIDRDDDDKLRFIQRVLESHRPIDVDRLSALEMVRAIRTRVLKEYAARIDSAKGKPGN
jgi:hypothetical protein